MLEKTGFRQLLSWLPSILVTLFFIGNASDKINPSVAQLKMGLTSPMMTLVGFLLLLFVLLFLIPKTMLLGAFFLTSYMVVVLVIHIRNGKPFLLTAGIGILIFIASMARCPLRGGRRATR